jgi:LysR family transcriptional regulator, hydrogen peroxide-inducible genes activator
MELHQLRYFIAVAETGNFTRAAEHCHVAQPSLSQQIINLESEIGHKLFHRLGRRAVPTEAGAVLLKRARRILFEVEDAARELGDQAALDRRITIGAVQTVMPFLLTPLIAQCRKQIPNLTIDALEGFRENLVRAVVEGELDLAVVPLPVRDRHLAIEPLLAEPLLLVVGRNHPFTTRREISVAELAGETFISLGDSSALAAQIREFFGGQNFEAKIRFRCAQVATLKLFVSNGLGISLLPELARLPEDREHLAYLRLTGTAPRRELVVIRHLQRYQTRGAENFLGLLREHAATRRLIEPGPGETAPGGSGRQ